MAQDSETPKPVEHAVRPELRSYGRRHGRKLSVRQEQLWGELLPRVALDLAMPFEPGAREVWLEIGFGGGEHLVWQAQRNPNALLIGAEPFRDGVIKVLDRIEAEGLGNIRLHADDARALLRWLPAGCLSRVFILFPDPWPKKRHVKRRLVASHLFALLSRAMAAGAELRIATDIGDYARTMLLAVREHTDFAWQATGPEDWRTRGTDWPGTRYEGKALAEGRRCYFFRFQKCCP
jgi:tRNA (guanine-N7-)-methyltransferase